MARRLAAAISHAPGLSGTPVFGHSDKAVTKASCASSSARLTSLTIRARPADEPCLFDPKNCLDCLMCFVCRHASGLSKQWRLRQAAVVA
jgi:hypothetical protein